jgi:hypothetical protein
MRRMRIRQIALVAALPLLIGATKADKAAAQLFADSVAEYGAVSGEILASELTTEVAELLSSLKGCKVRTVEQLANDDYGVQWRCPKEVPKPEADAVILQFENGKVSNVFISAVRRKYSVR